jgi:membrane protease YdiL (CAAX protease family)
MQMETGTPPDFSKLDTISGPSVPDERRGTLTEHSVRDRIGEHLRSSKFAILISIVLVLLLNVIDLIAPPLGIPIAVLSIWLIFWVSRVGWADIGMLRPRSWIKTIGLGIGVAVLLEALGLFVLFPAMQRFGVQLPDFGRFEAIKGNISILLVYLAVSWTTAGFGEEMIWRGFVMGRVARLFGDGKAAWVFSLLLTSVLFGLLHLYQGTSGVILTGVAGLVLGILYMASGRNLWAAIIAHGMTDSLSFLILYTGLWERLT